MDKDQIWRDALVRALERRAPDYLDRLADRLLDAAWAGDMDAYRELIDGLEDVIYARLP